MNRILKAEEQIRTRLAQIDRVSAERLGESMKLEEQEHFAYQNKQAEAHAAGVLTFDEAQTIYCALGEIPSGSNGGWTPETTPERKIAITMLMGELFGAKQ